MTTLKNLHIVHDTDKIEQILAKGYVPRYAIRMTEAQTEPAAMAALLAKVGIEYADDLVIESKPDPFQGCPVSVAYAPNPKDDPEYAKREKDPWRYAALMRCGEEQAKKLIEQGMEVHESVEDAFDAAVYKAATGRWFAHVQECIDREKRETVEQISKVLTEAIFGGGGKRH